MNKRDAVLTLLDRRVQPSYIPSAFFIHFDPSCHRGQPAIDKHLEYFRHTGMDFVKIQYESTFPYRPEIRRPEDWARLPLLGRDFFRDQIEVVAGLVKAAGKEALVIVTLYSPFMCAVHTTRRPDRSGPQHIVEHIREDPEKARKGMEIITESLMLFVRECVRVGVDGFYTSTQGGEADRISDPALFNQCIKPYDLALMKEAERSCPFNILHICDYHSGYDDLTRFLDYPGHVVNYSLHAGGRPLTGRGISEMFGRPSMGGMDRKGVIVSGGTTEIARAVGDVLRDAPERFILGADCTLPNDVNWDNIRAAISAAHEFRKSG